jgi:ribosome-binding factor A
MDRVNAYLLRILSEIVRDELGANNDLITLTDITATRDLKEATVTVTAIESLEQHVKLLNQRRGALRHRLKPLLDFKTIPNLTFVADTHGHDIAHVEQILDALP